MKNKRLIITAPAIALFVAFTHTAHAQITVGGNGGDTTDSTSYSGSQSLTKIGANTVTLTGSNTYTGGSFINSGILNLGGGSSSGGNFTVGSGSELRVTAANFWFNGTPVFNFTTNGGGTINTWGGVNFIMGGNANYTTSGGARNRIIGGSGINLNNYTASFNVARGSDATTDLEVETTAWNSGGITKTGNGIMTLTGANGYSGVTDIQAGTLVAANSSALGIGGHNSATQTWIRDGATLALQGNISSGEHFHVWGSGVDGLGAIRNLSGNNALYNTDNGGPGYALRSNTAVGVDAGSLSISGFYQSGGSYGLTKVGNGTLTLTGTNTYTGKTIVNAGTLLLGSGTSDIQSWSSDLDINNGSTVSFAGTRFDLSQTGSARTVTFGATGGNTFDSGTGVNLVDWAGNTFKTTGGARNFITGSSGLNINSGFTATLDVARGTDGTTDLLVSSYFWNDGSIAKTGNGIATLSGNNIYTGTTTISGGTLQIGNGGTSGALGSGNVLNNATLALNRSDNTIFSNAISGSGVVVKKGFGDVTFTGANTSSGGLMVSQGLTWAGSAANLGSGTITLGDATTGTGGRSDAGLLIDNAVNTTIANDILVTGAVGDRQLGGYNTGGSAANTWTGTITLERDLNLRAWNTTTRSSFDGQITGTGGINVTQGRVTIGNTGNDYTGATTVNAGTILQANANEVLPNATALTVNGTLRFYTGGGTETVGTLSGNGTIESIDGPNTLNVSGSSSSTFGGVIANGGGTIGLTKSGNGTLTLTGANTYTGDTTVSGGELKVNGSIASSDVTVNSGAVLSGSGQVGGISGAGSINPGNSPGILAAAWVDPSDGMFFNFEITDIKPEYSQATNSANDVLRLSSATPFTSAMDAGNMINVYFNVADFDLNQAFLGGIFTDESGDFTAMISGANFRYYVQDNAGSVTYNGVSYSELGAGFGIEVTTELETADFGSGAVNGRIMQFSVVPEPSSALLAAIGSLFLLRRRRKA